MISIRTFRSFLLLVFLAGPSIAFAQMSGSVNYLQLSMPVSSLQDVDLDAVSGTLGFEIAEGTTSFRLVAEGRLGTGISDDSTTVAKYISVTEKIEYLYGLNLRGELGVSDALYLFIVPGITRIDFDAGSRGDTSTEFSIGAGAGLNLGESVSVELGYERLDEIDAISLGLRFRF